MTSIDSKVSAIQQEHWPQLLAVLVRLFGNHNLDMAEEVLQEAFYKALLDWRNNGIPENPKAWLLKVAKNSALDKIRQTWDSHYVSDKAWARKPFGLATDYFTKNSPAKSAFGLCSTN